MPVRQGGRTIRDPRTGKEKREGGTLQDRTEGEIPKDHPAAARIAEIKRDQDAASQAETDPVEPSKVETGKTAGTKMKD
ncbi:hypothetical protein [Aurantimonas sp. 22II-16-19i]|uniref:hypothetical protein n=1 Tax=Aurantimonas sp. 22II-16-19i TaxID=1317114 RepID=UPI0009F7FEF1|nr:hypothetical protein [Aurantimonas sp. 22II-16-19i]ORE87819.1 hypothetical protein ATO4_25048 [Aurantimonas sp. 22II-16-19i]